MVEPITKQRVASGSYVWCVCPQYVHMAKWPNRANRARAARVRVRLAVGPGDVNHYRRVGSALILRSSPVESDFVFDTGASQTTVSRSVARALRLAPLKDKPKRAKMADGRFALFDQSFVGIRLGGTWRVVPCLIPHLRTEKVDNLLGMQGLLNDFLFCLTNHELHLFRRKRGSGRKVVR